MPYCLLSVFSDTGVPNNLSKSNFGRNNLSKTELGRNDLSKSLLGRNNPSKTDLGRNGLSKSLLGHKRLHTQTNALAKQSLKDPPLLYGDHKAG